MRALTGPVSTTLSREKMKSLIILLAVVMAGCSTPRHPPFAKGSVFVGQDYHGDGVYIYPFDSSQAVTTNAFITITNATTNVSFRVAVVNGYSRPIFLETSDQNFFRGFSSTKTFYDQEGESIGFHVEGGITCAGVQIPCVYLLGRHENFCGCAAYLFDYKEGLSFTGMVRHGFTNETPTEAEFDAHMVLERDIPKNAALIQMHVRACVTYYILGDPHRYHAELTLPVIVKRSTCEGQQSPGGDSLKAAPQE